MRVERLAERVGALPDSATTGSCRREITRRECAAHLGRCGIQMLLALPLPAEALAGVPRRILGGWGPFRVLHLEQGVFAHVDWSIHEL